MLVRFGVVAVFVIPLGIIAAPAPPEDDAAQMRRVYGEKVDPEKDSHFSMKKGKLRITVPGLHYEMVERAVGKMAPWIGKDVEGDFTAVVRVSFPIRPSTGYQQDGKWPAFAKAGLIAWVAEYAYVQVLRREETEEKGRKEHFESDIRLGDDRGSGTGTLRSDREKAVAAAFLQLRREGQTITVAHSRDGKRWTEFKTQKDLRWPDRVKIGVIAKNGYKDPFEATFDEFSVTQPKKK
jgi:regulation of enolase protein 1 (concanavalin A-like superfamily)